MDHDLTLCTEGLKAQTTSFASVLGKFLISIVIIEVISLNFENFQDGNQSGEFYSPKSILSGPKLVQKEAKQ